MYYRARTIAATAAAVRPAMLKRFSSAPPVAGPVAEAPEPEAEGVDEVWCAPPAGVSAIDVETPPDDTGIGTTVTTFTEVYVSSWTDELFPSP